MMTIKIIIVYVYIYDNHCFQFPRCITDNSELIGNILDELAFRLGG